MQRSSYEKKHITTLPGPLTFHPKYEDIPAKKATWNFSRQDFRQSCSLLTASHLWMCFGSRKSAGFGLDNF